MTAVRRWRRAALALAVLLAAAAAAAAFDTNVVRIEVNMQIDGHYELPVLRVFEGDRTDAVLEEFCAGGSGAVCDPATVGQMVRPTLAEHSPIRSGQAQLHSLVVWPTVPAATALGLLAQVARGTAGLPESLKVLEVFEVEWEPQTDPELKFRAFYAASYYPIYFPQQDGSVQQKLMHTVKGNGPFIAAIVADTAPLYAEIEDKGFINVNILQLKRAMRDAVVRQTGCMFCTHTSQLVLEAASDLWFLLGRSYDDLAAEYLAPARLAATWQPDAPLTRLRHNGRRPERSIAASELAQSTLRPTNVHDAVASILRNTWATTEHTPWNVYAHLHRLATRPDLLSDGENLIRPMLLNEPHAARLLALPLDVTWHRLNVTVGDLATVFTIGNGSEYCGPVSDMGVSPLIATVNAPRRASVRDLKAAIVGGSWYMTDLVVVAPSLHGPYTLLDGSLRAAVFYHILPHSRSISIVLGVSPSIERSSIWCHRP